MKTVIHKSESRGFANHGWLKSYHTFSFAGYYNQERMHFGALRVLNDDMVQPGMGFGTHPHKNMEIISIPLSGALSHKDSMDNKRAIEVGEVQVMSAGTGLTHSEFNDSKTEAVNFLQLWIIPEQENLIPRYDQKEFDLSKRENSFQIIVSPKSDVLEDALWINQQAYLSIGNFNVDKTTYNLKNKSNGVYAFVIDGEITINGEVLNKRDAIGIWETNSVEIKINRASEILLIEVPMV